MMYKPLVLSVALALTGFAAAQTAPAQPDTSSQPPTASPSQTEQTGSAKPDSQSAPAPATSTAPVAQTPAAQPTSASTDSDRNAAPAGQPAPKDAKDPLAHEATENLPKATDVKHDGSRDDVSAIGNRHIGTGKSPGDWYSIESEIRMGKGYAMQIESGMKLVQDPVVTEYVNRIGQNLVRNSDAKVPFTIKVVDSDEINAFALPGGFFYVNSGLILAADEEAELAGVMAHEIAHVAARHATRQMTRGQIANIASIPLILARFRSRGRLPGTAIYVRHGVRPASVYRVLRKGAGERKEEAGIACQGFLYTSADAGPHRKIAGRDRKDPSAARSVCRRYLGVPSGEVAARYAGKSPQG
jgi:hypothetical protein